LPQYVHTCRPARAAGEPAPRRAANGGRLTIDMHCHLLNEKVEALVRDTPEKKAEPTQQVVSAGEASAAHNRALMSSIYRPKLTDLTERLADMDAAGIDIQAISPAPTQYYYWAGDELADELVRNHNEAIAEICASNAGRFVGLGSVALQNPKRAAEQATHAVRTLGLRGIEISTLVNGVDIGDPRFDPFWAAMESLNAVVFLHPLGTTLGQRLDRFYLSNVVGQPTETAVSLSQMIFGGVFDRYAGLKLCAAHGGGYLPLYISRSDHAYAVRPESCGCARPPSSYLKQIWFDTIVYEPEHLRRLIDVVGVSQMVVGTDYPYDMGHYDPHALIDAIAGLSEREREQILGGNAKALLGIA
jgi:aminocarboxymuconate-semialdehyde decarboxylase